ncbi:MAG: (deoxy)nucleoside triphosphate pyrophosphohydrolase [Phycisphaeraceae bacterium]
MADGQQDRIGRVDVAVGALVERKEAGWRVLIARRRQDGVLGGYWELPGGKLEPGETPPECLAREMEEELGLSVAVGEPLPVVEHRYEHGLVRLHPYLCRAEGGRPRAIASSEIRWVGPGELDDYTFPPANGPLLEALCRALG